jgi:hypothetical protein
VFTLHAEDTRIKARITETLTAASTGTDTVSPVVGRHDVTALYLAAPDGPPLLTLPLTPTTNASGVYVGTAQGDALASAFAHVPDGSPVWRVVRLGLAVQPDAEVLERGVWWRRRPAP